MKIVLIGKSGQLGQELALQGVKREFNILTFSHQELDITDAKKVGRIIKSSHADVVINATAYHVVPDCELYPEEAFLVNAIAVRNVAQITQLLDTPFITYSTDYVFSGEKGSPYTEQDLPTPVQTYGISKVAGEYMALAYNQRAIVIRSSGVYGGKHGSRSKKGNFALNLLEKARTENSIEVSSEQIVNPTYAVDLAKATFDLLEHKDISGIYHLVNEGYCSWAEFASEIIKIKRLQTKIIPIDRKGMAGNLRRPLFSALKNTRAAKLGIKLPPWQDAIKRYMLSLGLNE